MGPFQRVCLRFFVRCASFSSTMSVSLARVVHVCVKTLLCTEGARAGEDPPQRPTPTSARPSRPLALRPVCRSAVSSAEFVARRLSPARPIAFTIARLEDSTTRTQSNMPSHASPHWPTCSRVAILGRGGLRCGACGRCLPQLLHLVQVVVHAVLKLTHHLDRGGRPAATIE